MARRRAGIPEQPSLLNRELPPDPFLEGSMHHGARQVTITSAPPQEVVQKPAVLHGPFAEPRSGGAIEPKEDLAVVVAEWLDRTGASLHISARNGRFLVVVHHAATHSGIDESTDDLDYTLRHVAGMTFG